MQLGNVGIGIVPAEFNLHILAFPGDVPSILCLDHFIACFFLNLRKLFQAHICHPESYILMGSFAGSRILAYLLQSMKVSEIFLCIPQGFLNVDFIVRYGIEVYKTGGPCDCSGESLSAKLGSCIAPARAGSMIFDTDCISSPCQCGTSMYCLLKTLYPGNPATLANS